MTQPHQQLVTYQPWISGIAASAAKNLGLPDGITVQDGVFLSIDDSVPVEKISEMIVSFVNFGCKQKHQEAIIRINLSRAILEIAAREKITESEAIDNHNLCDRTGLTLKTLLNWAGIAKKVSADMLLPGVTWSQLRGVASVNLPEDPKQVFEIREEQRRILEDASANPHECGESYVKQEMGKVLEKMGIVEPPKPGGTELLLRYAVLLRKLRYVEETGCVWQAVGEMDRGSVVDKIADLEASLVNMEILSATVEIAKPA